jgi:hypothetical protein
MYKNIFGLKLALFQTFKAKIVQKGSKKLKAYFVNES